MYSSLIPNAQGVARSPDGAGMVSGVEHILILAAVFGIPGALLWKIEHRHGPAAARWGLVLLTAICAAFLSASAGVLGALVVTGLLWVAALGYGSLAARWLDIEDARSAWGDLPFVAAVGLSIVVLLVILAGVAGVLSQPVVAAVFLVGVALAALSTQRAFVRRRSVRQDLAGSPASVWWWGLAVLVLIGMVGAVAPDVRHDALAMHLPIAREFATNRAIVEMRQQIQSYFPGLNGHVLYAAGMLFVPGETVPKLMHYFAGVHAGLLTYSLGARLSTPWVGLASAGVFASTPIIYDVGRTAGTDLWSVLFAVASVMGLAGIAERPNLQRALAAGLMAGTAVGFKLTSLVVALPVAIALPLVSGHLPRRLKTRMGMFGTFTLGAVVGGAFWFGRAWALTGNPVFPMLNAVFKSPLWPLENTRFNMHLFGMGTSLWDLVRLPWDLSLHPQRFVEFGSIGLIYLFLLPIALWTAARRGIAFWMWWVVVLGGLLWFFGAQYLRYLLPLLPLAAIIGTVGVLGGAVSGRVSIGAGFVLIIALMVTAVGWTTSGSGHFPLVVVRGQMSRADYTAAYVGGFRVAEYVRRSLPQSARIYGAGEDMAFHYEHFFVPMSWRGRLFDASLPAVVLKALAGSEIQAALRQAGFSHIVVNREHPMIVQLRRADGWLAREAFWEEAPRLEYAYGEYYLFQLSAASGTQVRRGAELLANPEMTPDPMGAPMAWERNGTVSLRQVASGPEGPKMYARLGRGAYLVQRVAVAPNTLYALESSIRALGPSGTARLFIQYFDDRGFVIDYSTWRRVKIGPSSRRYAMANTAPHAARSAQVWLITDQTNEAEFSAPSFYTLR